MLILSMVSLPTSLPKHLLVETADKGGDDYQGLPPPRPPPFYDYVMEKQNKGKLFMIPWSFIPTFRHSRQSKQFMTLF